MEIIMGIFFAIIPAMCLGIVASAAHPILGFIVFLGVFGFGLDCYFNGSGGN